MINLQPTLIGKLARIRPIRPEDFTALHTAASDPQIWVQHPQPRRWEKEYFRESFFNSAIACGGGLVYENLEGEIIGSTRYYNYRPQTRDIMIGYTFLAKKYWGKAYNRQAKHMLMTHIFQWVDTTYFSVGAFNVRSRTAMERIGGVLLGPQQLAEKRIQSPGAVIFEIRKSDFKGLI